MSIFPELDSGYQVGGSLAPEHHTYVTRKADNEFYENLKRGKFCYVFNSRQTGKSSLCVSTMQKLQKDNIVCIDIDISSLCEKSVTQEEWYGGLFDKLVRGLDVNIASTDWWKQNKLLTPLQRLSKFIETEVLKRFNEQSIVIFIDEIDGLIDLSFKEDFFVFIRECRNNRATKKNYNRLTFALLGVANPSDLITDSSRTPFNTESKAIELTGFTLEEAEPLQKVLEGKVNNPKIIIESVLKWTKGQPFLTQRLCQIILSKHSEIPDTQDSVEKFIEKIVRSQIIEIGFYQEETVHLKTIRDRLIDSKNSPKLLKLYQNILREGQISADNSKEQLELRLSGLVVYQQGKLKVYNPIYKNIFDEDWVKEQLKKRSSTIELIPENTIFEGLKRGNFCYVLSSPIKAKEEILEKVKKDLESNNIPYAIINSEIHRHKSAQNFEWHTRGEWYFNLATKISKDFKIDINILKKWWSQEKEKYKNFFPDYDELLNDYLEQQLLDRRREKRLVIIFDSFVSKNSDNNQEEYQHLFDDLVFKDEVFRFIYSCYEKRRINLDYNRLTFLLIDTAIHPKYIEAKNNTITVGWIIDFEDSHPQEVIPFIIGDDTEQKSKFDYQKVLESIWNKTNGHPFLTQKLIELSLREKHNIIHGQETDFINNLVATQIIKKIKIPNVL